MLQSLRSSAKSWVMTILFGFLILSFAVWGIGDIFRSGGQQAVIAEVGGVEISRNMFLREYQREVSRLQERLGGQVPPDFFSRLGLGPQVAGQMVERTLYDLAATDLGLLVSDKTVALSIRSEPNFQGIGGFDRLRYEQAVRSIGLTVAGYEAQLKRDLGRSRLIEAIAAFETPPKSLTEKLYKFRNERRVAEIIRIPADTATVAEPGQTAVEAWHKDHAKDFMAPGYREISAIVLRPEDLMAEISISEEKLKELYDMRSDEFTTQEKRTAAQIVFQDEEMAKKAHALLGQGKTLAEAAKEAGNEQEALELGELTRGSTLPEIADAIFAVAEGAVSAPVKSPLGWHIVKVSKIKPGGITPYAEARDKLAEGAKRDQAIAALYDLANAVEDSLSGGATIDEAGKTHNVKVLRIPALDSQGNGRDRKPVAELPKETEFLSAAFDTPEGTESELIEASTGAAFIVKVEKVTPPVLRPLDEVRDVVIAAWKDDQAREKARSEAERIADAVRSGRPVSDIVAENKLTVDTTKPFTRDGAGAEPPLPRALVGKVFDAARAKVVTADDATGSVVARVKTILGVDPAQGKEVREKLVKELAQSITEDLIAQFASSLQSSYSVEINAEAIEAAIQPVNR